MDASKIAYFATMYKLKNDALRLVYEDKSFCKSILMEYAARKNIQRPTYETRQIDTPIPVFRSSLVFNDVSCTGDDCKSKKEAEQSAAHAFILKFLVSDTENVMSEIINCKFRNHAETMDIPGAHNGTNAVVQTGVDNCISSNEGKVEEETKMLNEIALPEPSLEQDTTMPPRNIPEESQALPLVLPVPTSLALAPNAGTGGAPISSQIPVPSLEQLARIIANHFASNMVRPPNSEAPSGIVATPPVSLASPTLPQPTVASQTSAKKRNRKNKKNGQKKMRVEEQMINKT